MYIILLILNKCLNTILMTGGLIGDYGINIKLLYVGIKEQYLAIEDFCSSV